MHRIPEAKAALNAFSTPDQGQPEPGLPTTAIWKGAYAEYTGKSCAKSLPLVSPEATAAGQLDG